MNFGEISGIVGVIAFIASIINYWLAKDKKIDKNEADVSELDKDNSKEHDLLNKRLDEGALRFKEIERLYADLNIKINTISVKVDAFEVTYRDVLQTLKELTTDATEDRKLLIRISAKLGITE